MNLKTLQQWEETIMRCLHDNAVWIPSSLHPNTYETVFEFADFECNGMSGIGWSRFLIGLKEGLIQIEFFRGEYPEIRTELTGIMSPGEWGRLVFKFQ